MWLTRCMLLFLLALGLAACQGDHPSGPDTPARAQHPFSSPKNPFAMPALLPKSADESPPEPGEVLRAIYKKAGDGSANYSIGKGIWAGYWYGHAYHLDGRRYYTGFAYNTEAADTNRGDFPAPGDRVSISQATYVRAPEGSVAVWEFVGAQRDIGRFGGRGRGNAIDDHLMPQTHLTPGGDYLVAVPAWYLASGVRMSTAEVFRLERRKMQWEYLGSVATGEDNSAACAELPGDGLPQCAISTGELTFRQRPGKDMPSILVAMKGKVEGEPGGAGVLGSLEGREYFFDQEKGRFQ